MEKTKNFIIKWPWISVAIAVLIAGGIWYFTKAKTPVAIDYATVQRGTVSQVVSVTGYVKPASNVDLSFEKGGRISGVYRDVGDRVGTGDTLIVLDSSEITAQLAQAQAVVKVQEAKLDSLKAGSRPADIAASQAALQKAQQDLANLYASISDSTTDGYAKATDAVRTQLGTLFSNAETSQPQLTFQTANSQSDINVIGLRVSSGNELNAWQQELIGMSPSSSAETLTAVLKKNLSHLSVIQNLLSTVAFTLNGSTNLSASQLATDKANVSTALSEINTVVSNFNTVSQNIASQQSTVAQARAQLDLKQAGSTTQDIAAQEAELESAKASVMNLQAQLARTVIRSPISGIVTKQDAKRGEIANPGNVLISIISDSKYQIEANVAEADIAKIKIGDVANVTLDAYGSDVVFTAIVTKIDPSDTIVDGVPTYKTTLQFKQDDPRIRSGMTANTDIAGISHENVLYIPGRSIAGKGTGKTVTAVEGDTTREAAIETGLRGSNGDVEILSGLKEGNRVKISP